MSKRTLKRHLAEDARRRHLDQIGHLIEKVVERVPVDAEDQATLVFQGGEAAADEAIAWVTMGPRVLVDLLGELAVLYGRAGWVDESKEISALCSQLLEKGRA